MIGPSIILLGLGLGSGEIILWPYLVSYFGLGIIWAAIVGITFQFFINTEIERYSLARGESIFVGFKRLTKIAPYWFIFSTFVAWFWPGIIATSAKILASLFGIQRYDHLAIVLLLLIGLILTLGPRLYKTVESFQKVLIGFGVPAIAIITFLVAKYADWRALGYGLLAVGQGYNFLPIHYADFPLFTFIGAMAYAGAGGNLNLAQSFYIKEKGYGMCHGTKGISSVLHKKNEAESLEGKMFSPTRENFARFKRWWKLANREHFLVFLLTGAITIILLALLSYSTARQSGLHVKDVEFIIYEANMIGTRLTPFFGVLFLALAGLMLFGTQLTILDSTSRIIAENVEILRRKAKLSRTYYIVLWLQILAGIIVFMTGFNNPLMLVITGAVINAFAMFVHIGATWILNRKSLPKEIWAGKWRTAVLAVAFVFFGAFTIYSVVNAILK